MLSASTTSVMGQPDAKTLASAGDFFKVALHFLQALICMITGFFGESTTFKKDSDCSPHSKKQDASIVVTAEASSSSLTIEPVDSPMTSSIEPDSPTASTREPADSSGSLSGDEVELQASVEKERYAHMEMVLPKGVVRAPPGLGLPAQAVDDTQSCLLAREWQYSQLSNNISQPAFNAKAEQFLGDVVDVLCNNLPFSIDHIVKGGAVRKEVAIAENAHMEIVFFLKALPMEDHHQWLTPLLNVSASVLKESLGDFEFPVESVNVMAESVQLKTKTGTVDVRFSPVYESYRAMLSTMSRQPSNAAKFFEASTVKQRVQFVKKQPSHVKVTIKLLKWWRDQQKWSSDVMRPSDAILEIIAIHSASCSNSFLQDSSMSRVMTLLSEFDTLRIVVPDYYSENDVSPSLLPQRPLLLDPANPFLNLADSKKFDASELMTFAKMAKPEDFF